MHCILHSQLWFSDYSEGGIMKMSVSCLLMAVVCLASSLFSVLYLNGDSFVTETIMCLIGGNVCRAIEDKS